jgi:hypothetical protein
MKIDEEKREQLEELIVSYNMWSFADGAMDEACKALKAMGVTDKELEAYKVKEIYYEYVEDE